MSFAKISKPDVRVVALFLSVSDRRPGEVQCTVFSSVFLYTPGLETWPVTKLFFLWSHSALIVSVFLDV
jgi:hypothetical protein